MNLFNVPNLGVPNDPVPTEKTLIEQLAQQDIPGYTLVVMNTVKIFNTVNPQYIIDQITERQDKKLIFVCQHINVGQINWYGNIVCTPHATVNDYFISVPHYAVNFKDVKKVPSMTETENGKKYFFSFLGAGWTSPVRRRLIEMYPEYCFDTLVSWGIDKKDDKEFVNKYLDLLDDSYYSLCPRGTGIGSIRLWESMAMNSWPIIIADGYKKPLEDILRWNDFSITLKENDIDNLKQKIIEKLKTNIFRQAQDVYLGYFSNDKLYLSVTIEMKNRGLI